MKRIGNLWDKIVSKENIELAYTKAKRHKAWQRKVIAIEKQKDKLLNELQESLVNGTYHTAKYRIKTIYEPKKREIYILPFYPDRIVHHAIMNVLEPIWNSYLINDTYACRRGKGQHKGSTRCMEFVRKNKFCLKCDISKFYPSIPHAELKILIRRKIKCKKTLMLLMENINKLALVTPPLQDKSPYQNILEGGLADKKLSVSHLPKLQLHALTVTSSGMVFDR